MSIHPAPDARLAVLAHLAGYLRAEPSGGEEVMSGIDLYGLIRLCLLKAEGRRRPRDARVADDLYARLTAAYERSGAFLGTSKGQPVL